MSAVCSDATELQRLRSHCNTSTAVQSLLLFLFTSCFLSYSSSAVYSLICVCHRLLCFHQNDTKRIWDASPQRQSEHGDASLWILRRPGGAAHQERPGGLPFSGWLTERQLLLCSISEAKSLKIRKSPDRRPAGSFPSGLDQSPLQQTLCRGNGQLCCRKYTLHI